MIRRVPSKQRNTLVKRERDPRALTRLALLLLCGLMLAGGFVYAGGRHFASLKLGYETEKLRNALNAAREDRRRLILEREAAASPARLELAARKLGMQPMQPAQIDPLKQHADVSSLKPAAGTKPTAETKPVAGVKLVAETRPLTGTKPTAETRPEAGRKPVAETKATAKVDAKQKSKQEVRVR